MPAIDIDQAIRDYIRALKEASPKSTEMTLRGSLENLLNAMAGEQDKTLQLVHEPRMDRESFGRPDFLVRKASGIIGYIETKKLGEDLNKVAKSEQIKKYNILCEDIIITDYKKFIRLHNLKLAKPFAEVKLPEQQDEFKQLINSFFAVPPKEITRAKQLAQELAGRTQILKGFIDKELKRQEEENQKGKLYGLYKEFKENVFHELTLAEFGDAFAQTLAYGLFFAKLNAENEKVTLDNAKKYIPSNFGLIKELVGFLDELEEPEYEDVKWLIDAILAIINNIDLIAIHEELSYTEAQRRLWKDEEEQIVFARDPYVYFYENFLETYDKATRKGRGVYYTPPPVVRFIIHAIQEILKKDFGVKTGLADHKKVTLLDFAAGTGTFLVEVFRKIFEATDKGMRDLVVEEHILKNLYGFEYLVAPYVIAHLKLSQFLRDKWQYTMKKKERLQIYLTNTLEPIDPKLELFVPALSKEVKQAQGVKDKSILVITGNPPYSGISKNKGAWIAEKIDTYKYVDGEHFGEKKHWLNDDYVKFIRFAQWKMEQAEEGIVGIISNHSFLDNPTFRGMRQSLMKVFDKIYVLDLHGNAKKKETAPDGGEDKNVFDIQQGVAISLFIKRRDLKKSVYHADLYGRRQIKYKQLIDNDFTRVEWRSLKPISPFYLFIPQDNKGQAQYKKGWKITDIFQENVTGIVSARDHLAISFSDIEALEKLNDFADKVKSTDSLRKKYFPRKASQTGKKYPAGDTRGWKIPSVRGEIRKEKPNWKEYMTFLSYRPFDIRRIYYRSSFVDWGRWDIMHHMLAGENVGLTTTRQVKTGHHWLHFLVSNTITESTYVSNRTSEIGYLFPLYLYPPDEKDKKKQKELLKDDPFQGKKRIENLTPAFRKFIDQKYNKAYTPEQILGYIYAVLHSPTYRKKYLQFLKMDFPHIPFVESHKLFEKLAKLGLELVEVHLLKKLPAAQAKSKISPQR